MLTPRAPARRRPSAVPRPDRTSPGGPSAELLAAARGVPSLCGGEATALYDGTDRTGSPRLVVTAGPCKGSEFALLARVTTLGRSRDNAIGIPDVSMSRRHSRLEKHGETWVVFDQGSGNGTSVNGTPVARHRLRHGDEIGMGDTTARFVEPGGVLVWEARADSSLRARMLLCTAVAVALITIVGAVLVRQQRLSEIAAARARGERIQALSRARFAEGVTLVQQGLWAEGRDKLRVAAELNAGDAEIARQLEAAETEVVRAQALATAKEALRRQDPEAAREALAQIPGESAMAEEASVMRSRLKPVPEAKVLAGAGSAQPPGKSRTRARTTGLSPEAKAIRAILAAYLAGDLTSAVDRARAAQSDAARRLGASLERFIAAYDAGLAEQDPAAAVRWLEVAAHADRGIALGRKGSLERNVAQALAARHLLIAQGLPGDDDLPLAAAHLRAAVESDPSSGGAQALLRQVSDRAREIYVEGYVARDQDPEQARRAFRVVANVLPAADETAQKARRWLEKLDGKVAE
jgi:hypothetical protein